MTNHFSIFVILCWGCWGHYKPEGQLTSSALAGRTLLVSSEGPTCHRKHPLKPNCGPQKATREDDLLGFR